MAVNAIAVSFKSAINVRAAQFLHFGIVPNAHKRFILDVAERFSAPHITAGEENLLLPMPEKMLRVLNMTWHSGSLKLSTPTIRIYGISITMLVKSFRLLMKTDTAHTIHTIPTDCVHW